jgi:hypothetical protein
MADRKRTACLKRRSFRLRLRGVRIPGQIGQRFQFNTDTESNSIRTGIPIQIGQ